jgi:3-dehydroquinate synthase
VGAAHYAVVSDAHVGPLHAARVHAALTAAGPASLHLVPAGEASKSRTRWAELTDALLAAGMGRDGCLVALGGGVVGDLAGFVAATYMRGVPLVQVPTSLLAMVDASVGGKTGIDVPAGKNLVGAFHQPRLVLADPDVLATLPLAELRAGLAEAVKHGLIADADYLAGIEAEADDLLARNPAVLERLVHRSVEIKAAVVGRDPLEAGERAILNAGHTVAHALERVTGYELPHGLAVAVGLVVEARAGESAGHTADGTADRLARVLGALGLAAAPPAGTDPEAVLAAMATDKKGRGGRPRYALPEAPGRMARAADGGWTLPLDEAHVRSALDHARTGLSAGPADV